MSTTPEVPGSDVDRLSVIEGRLDAIEKRLDQMDEDEAAAYRRDAMEAARLGSL